MSNKRVHQNRYYSEKEGNYLGSVEFPFEVFQGKIWEMDLYFEDCNVVGQLYKAWYCDTNYFFSYVPKDLRSDWYPFVQATQCGLERLTGGEHED